MRNGQESSKDKGQLIVIAGLMGCGKSTLVGQIKEAKQSNVTVFRELAPKDNPFFSQFYEALSTAGENPYALPSQLAFLNHSFEQAKQIARLRQERPKHTIVWEMPPWAHFMYAWLQHKGESPVMSREDWLVYRANFKVIWKQMSELPLLPHLTAITFIADLDTLCKRINDRGRSEENSIPRDYLERLQHYWSNRLTQNTLLPKKAQRKLEIPEGTANTKLTLLDAAKKNWTTPSGFYNTWQYMMQNIATPN